MSDFHDWNIEARVRYITQSMNKWRKDYNNKFKNWEIFWEMFFKEMERQLTDNK
jgi:hypothetical protein